MFISARSHTTKYEAVVFGLDIKMGGLLGKNKKRVTRATDQEDAITRLNEQRNRLRMHSQLTERSVETNRELAKQKLQEGNREEAKTSLKKKIYHERELGRSNAQLDKINQMINDLELARMEAELTSFVERKVKRGRWKSIIKSKHKQQNYSSRRKLGKPVREDIEIQVLGVFNKKERDKRSKAWEKTRKAINKQKQIAVLISGQLSEGDETAVEKELEVIMNSGYQLPDIDQYTYEAREPHEEVTAISA